MDRSLIVLCALIVSSFADDDLLVQIEDGKIQGKFTTNLDGELIYSFLGIPYGKFPKRDLRFKHPVPVEPWNKTHDGTKMGECCFQDFIGSEDCLNLNVHTKELKPTELKPVMVWIHGGGFYQGSNQLYGPEFLLLEDIVFVAINYRLGMLGFLSLKNTTLGVPGNAGLKDQALALKWVQKNIQHFGGDPDKVTIFGEDAGAVSVHYHVVSPASRGLFHKAIIQSGAVLNPWAIVDRQLVWRFIEFLQLGNITEGIFLEEMKYDSVREIYEHQEVFMKGISTPFGPVIEDPNDSQFITESGLDILKSGKYNKVPIMMGYCSNEGLILEIEKRKVIVNETERKGQESHMEAIAPLGMNLQTDQSEGSHINRELIDIYFKGVNADNKYLMSSDYYFISGILGSAELHANNSQHPVYLYKMSLDAGRNFQKRTNHLDDFPGVCHGDDLGYLFDMTGLEMGDQEEQYVRTFVKLWTNFAKYGNPTPDGTDLGVEWKPVDENQYFLDIGEELTLKSKPEEDRMFVWKEIYPDIHLQDMVNACATSSLLSSLIPTFFFLILCMDI